MPRPEPKTLILVLAQTNDAHRAKPAMHIRPHVICFCTTAAEYRRTENTRYRPFTDKRS